MSNLVTWILFFKRIWPGTEPWNVLSKIHKNTTFDDYVQRFNSEAMHGYIIKDIFVKATYSNRDPLKRYTNDNFPQFENNSKYLLLN